MSLVIFLSETRPLQQDGDIRDLLVAFLVLVLGIGFFVRGVVFDLNVAVGHGVAHTRLVMEYVLSLSWRWKFGRGSASGLLGAFSGGVLGLGGFLFPGLLVVSNLFRRPIGEGKDDRPCFLLWLVSLLVQKVKLDLDRSNEVECG
jgi:hypothetical protein